MQIKPRYGNRPALRVDLPLAGVHPVAAQRRRLGALLGELSESEWQHPSRCAGWSVQDVVSHLTSTNGFWAVSIQSGVAGRPTELLASFDPVATPAQLLERDRDVAVAETLARYLASTDAMVEVIEALSAADWDRVGEAPPGHLPISQVADHALWDAWVHERDIVLPLERTATLVDDEIVACLRYCAALGPAFTLAEGAAEPAAVELTVTNPDLRLVVEIDGGDAVRVHTGAAPAGALVVRGDAVEVVEMVSRRVPAPTELAGLQWLTAGLAAVFDEPAPA